VEIKSIEDMDVDALYETYADEVYQVALRYSRNHHIAEEITQAVFVELCDGNTNVDLKNVEAWLCTSARNKAISYWRKTNREYMVASVFEEMDNIVHIECFDNMKGNDNMDDYFLAKLLNQNRSELLDKIYDDLYEKNDRWYLVIMGAYVLEIPQTILAEKLGLSLGSLQTMLTRAKKWIRKRYQKEFERLEKE